METGGQFDGPFLVAERSPGVQSPLLEVIPIRSSRLPNALVAVSIVEPLQSLPLLE